MQSLKKFYFGKQKAKVNTFIGGIGGTINTPALLASKLGISESRIKLFKVTGVDIECAIIGNYSMEFGLQVGGLLTYFIDADGLATTFGTIQNFVNQTNMRQVYAPKTTYVRGAMCYNSSQNLKIVYMPLCTTFGEYNSSNIFVGQTSNSSMFLNSTSALKLYLHPSLATVNAGNPDPDILDVTGRGGIVRYVTNFTPPNQITDLTVGTIYNSAVQLNFTPPTAVNGIDFYEVYVNGRYYQDIPSSGSVVTGLSTTNTYNIEVYAVDMFYNKSKSNAISVTTANITYTDADAIAYNTASGISTIQQQESVHVLVNGFKDNGLWTKIQAGWLFKGATANNQKYNIKNPQDTDAAFRLQFFGTGTYSDLGFQCNGSNAYADTKFIPSVNQNVNSNGLTVVVGTNNTKSTFAVEIGSENSNTQASLIFTSLQTSNKAAGSDANSKSTRITVNNYNNASGVFTSTKQSANVNKLFRNAIILGTNTGGGSLPTPSVWIGKYNSLLGPTQGYSNQRRQMAFIHEGLTDAEVQKMHEIIDASETIAGRKTW